MDKYILSIGVDISSTDVEVDPDITEKISRELPLILPKGVKAAISNITGDDIVITSFTPERLIEDVNRAVLHLLKKHAKGFEDLEGVSKNPEEAREGVSYAVARAGSPYGDSVILSFDTYGGEDVVDEIALFVGDIGRKYGYDVGVSVSEEPKEIPGIGYTGRETDDPVVVVTFEDLKDLPKLSGLIFGGLLSFENLYFVRNGSPVEIVPPGVIYTMSAFLNGNVIDLYPGITKKLKKIL
ncbi:MAG TPA: hypothetical protein EYH15_02605 [Methanothermococcus okinawensis]|uniref:Uncharacterized protein n=1 Tax=Methanothermococcus okinawensis TaxID=155863 RepID=A0A832ZK27_9EURY|nr:hypothetical protein [Methanothermococcus okinawensis]HIP91604.1 hypothetical protein [Methanothermococcus okinawensis]